MKVNEFKIKFWVSFWCFLIIGSYAFFFPGNSFGPNVAYAVETNWFEQTQVTTGPAYWYRFLADNFTLTERQLTSGVRHYFAATSTEINLKAYILRNNCTNAGCFDEDLVVDSCILHYAGSGLAETVACEFDYTYTLFPGDFHIRFENLYYPNPIPQLISSTQADAKLSSSVYYNINGTFGTNAGDHLNVELYYDDTLIEADVTTIEIDPWTGEEFVSNEYFTIQDSVECLIATACPIKFWYGPDNIGSDVYLLKQGEGDLTEYDDMISGLSDKPLLSDTLYPDISSTTGTELYQYFVVPATGSSSLYTYTKVYWVEELTQESTDNSLFVKIFNIFKRMFPLSLVFQIYDIFSDVKNNVADTEYLNVGIADLVDEELFPYFSTSTSIILSKNIFDENLPIWSQRVYPTMESLVYLMNLLLIVFIFWPRKDESV